MSLYISCQRQYKAQNIHLAGILNSILKFKSTGKR